MQQLTRLPFSNKTRTALINLWEIYNLLKLCLVRALKASTMPTRIKQLRSKVTLKTRTCWTPITTQSLSKNQWCSSNNSRQMKMTSNWAKIDHTYKRHFLQTKRLKRMIKRISLDPLSRSLRFRPKCNTVLFSNIKLTIVKGWTLTNKAQKSTQAVKSSGIWNNSSVSTHRFWLRRIVHSMRVWEEKSMKGCLKITKNSKEVR